MENVNADVYSKVPVRDEMSEEEFNSMIERGLNEARNGKSRLASEVFEEIREEMWGRWILKWSPACSATSPQA